MARPPSRNDSLLRALDPDQSGPLRVGGQSVADLAARFGTPTFVYHGDGLRQRQARVRAAFGPGVDLLFAIKANPSLAVAQVLGIAGTGADVASAGELHLARHAGISGDRVQFAGPGKTRDELSLALDHGIGAINLESAAEYDLLCEVLRGRPDPGATTVALRINPAEGVADARMRMGGASSKFGVDVEQVAALVRRIRDDRVIGLRGLHCYLGTQMFDADAWLASVAGIFAFARELEASEGVTLGSLNLGGGFGVAVSSGDPEFDLDAAAAGLARIQAEDGRHRRLCIELGRYLTAPAGIFVTRVLYTKESRGQRIAITDGGMHQFGAAAGVGAVIRRPYPIVRVASPSASGVPHKLCGPLCTPADEFAHGVDLPPLEPGDLVAVLAAGAYGLSFSPVLFLSHPTPAEVLVDGGQPHLIRERGRPEDALRGQVLPDPTSARD